MQSAVTDEIVEKLKGITLLEASELVKVRLQNKKFFHPLLHPLGTMLRWTSACQEDGWQSNALDASTRHVCSFSSQCLMIVVILMETRTS